jgi:hypothetical protein
MNVYVYVFIWICIDRSIYKRYLCTYMYTYKIEMYTTEGLTFSTFSSASGIIYIYIYVCAYVCLCMYVCIYT